MQNKDIGRGRLSPSSVKLQYAFETPTLRDVARRHPYMHDGSLATLDDVIDLYDRGGIDRPSRDGLIHRLNLPQSDKADLSRRGYVAFQPHGRRQSFGHQFRNPTRLELEITETVLLQDDRAVLDALHQFCDLGVRICMDDFGTGYSSLSYLRSFPFDKIKIDRSFIRELGKANDCVVIIRAVLGLGSSLGMITTAERVETEQQLEILKAEGCMQVQGYLFSRPKPAAEIPAVLRQLRPRDRAA